MHKIIIIIFVTLCHLSSQNIFTLNYHREDWRIIKESVNLYNTSDKLFIEINTNSPYTLINHSKEATKSNVIIAILMPNIGDFSPCGLIHTNGCINRGCINSIN